MDDDVGLSEEVESPPQAEQVKLDVRRKIEEILERRKLRAEFDDTGLD